MSVTCGFYNSLSGDRKYDAIQMSQIFDGIVNDGVYMSIGDHLNVTPNAGMTISVGTGRAWFNHTWTLNDAILPLTLDDAEVIVNRIDAIVLEVNAERETRNNEIKIVKGTPATVPEKPTLVNTDDIHQYPLAYITVDHDVTEITASMIENAVGTSATPFVTGIIETINIDTLVAQWGAQWTEWFAQQKSTMEEWTEEQQTEFEEWVETIRYIFDDTTAGRLMNYIDAVKTAALDYNKFELSASSWVANTDSYASSYPYCYHVRTNKYTADAHPTWALNGPGDTMPTITHYKNAIKYIYEAEFDSTGITLYAVKQPTENLCLCVKGRAFHYEEIGPIFAMNWNDSEQITLASNTSVTMPHDGVLVACIVPTTGITSSLNGVDIGKGLTSNQGYGPVNIFVPVKAGDVFYPGQYINASDSVAMLVRYSNNNPSCELDWANAVDLTVANNTPITISGDGMVFGYIYAPWATQSANTVTLNNIAVGTYGKNAYFQYPFNAHLFVKNGDVLNPGASIDTAHLVFVPYAEPVEYALDWANATAISLEENDLTYMDSDGVLVGYSKVGDNEGNAVLDPIIVNPGVPACVAFKNNNGFAPGDVFIPIRNGEWVGTTGYFSATDSLIYLVPYAIPNT